MSKICLLVSFDCHAKMCVTQEIFQKIVVLVQLTNWHSILLSIVFSLDIWLTRELWVVKIIISGGKKQIRTSYGDLNYHRLFLCLDRSERRMFLINLPLNLKEKAAIERRRREEQERISRIFNEKYRTIGVRHWMSEFESKKMSIYLDRSNCIGWTSEGTWKNEENGKRTRKCIWYR